MAFKFVLLLAVFAASSAGQLLSGTEEAPVAYAAGATAIAPALILRSIASSLGYAAAESGIASPLISRSIGFESSLEYAIAAPVGFAAAAPVGFAAAAPLGCAAAESGIAPALPSRSIGFESSLEYAAAASGIASPIISTRPIAGPLRSAGAPPLRYTAAATPLIDRAYEGAHF